MNGIKMAILSERKVIDCIQRESIPMKITGI